MNMNPQSQPDQYRVERLDEATAAMLRSRTPAERLAIAFGCNRMMRLRIEGHLRTHHPDWDDAQVAAEVARRMSRGSTSPAMVAAVAIKGAVADAWEMT